jgi:hypothetical protein
MALSEFRGGALAGIVGGIVIALWTASVGAALGDDLWIATKTAAYGILGPRVMLPGFDGTAVLLGLVCHFAVSLVWGVLFAAVAFGLSRRDTIWAGALWGILVWIGMFYVVLPLTDAGIITQTTPIARAIVEHLVFGLAVGLVFLPYQRPQTSLAFAPRARETATPGVR